MTENQLLKLWLIEKFAISDEPKTIEVCQKAYNFMVENKQEAANISRIGNALTDGVYYLTEDKAIAPYKTASASLNNIKGILIVQGERSIVVALNDSPADEETELTTKSDPDDCQGNYIQTYIDAVDDWNGKENTEHLKAVGLSPNIHLEDGQYIPSMGEMLFIFTHRKAINEALEKIKAQPIAGDWYWTATEDSATNAWYLNLNSGIMDYYTKATYTNRVRPVSAFIR